MNVGQELFCHECSSYVQFNLDMDLEGKHILHCPVCGHEHYRIVKDGVVTEERWGSNNNHFIPSFTVSSGTVTSSTVSTYSSTTSGSYFTYQNWTNSTYAFN